MAETRQQDLGRTGPNESLGNIPNLDAQQLLDQQVDTPVSATLGTVITRTDIQSTEGPFRVLPDYKTHYPGIVTQALGNLYEEYNRAFGPLVEANREWDTDYQYALAGDGTPINRWVQIDMVALPDEFLTGIEGFREEEVRETLRGRIFEIENSLAMYQLLAEMFSFDGQPTLFKREFRASLDCLREKHRKPIALLAVTDQKHKAMRESEFGKRDGELLTDQEVRELSGFDRLFGPKEFQQYLMENEGECGYLLYARTSDPIAKLRKPDTRVEVPLLDNEGTRKVIKANAITFNIDGLRGKINDTKEYLPPMGMAHTVSSAETLNEDLGSDGFRKYLLSRGANPEEIDDKTIKLRGKPMYSAYGGYGHHRAELGNLKFLRDLRSGIRKRGPYVIQPEMKTPIIINETDGTPYTYIDRDFFTTDGQTYRFMSGFRSLMPLDTQEVDRGRIHGNGSTVWAEIT